MTAIAAAAGRAPHKFTLVAGCAAFVTAVELVRLLVFMASGGAPDAERRAVEPVPHPPLVRHRRHRRGHRGEPVARHIYHPRMYSVPGTTELSEPKRPTIGPFDVDLYEYLPTFLAVPRLVAVVGRDFGTFRIVRPPQI